MRCMSRTRNKIIRRLCKELRFSPFISIHVLSFFLFFFLMLLVRSCSTHAGRRHEDENENNDSALQNILFLALSLSLSLNHSFQQIFLFSSSPTQNTEKRLGGSPSALLFFVFLLFFSWVPPPQTKTNHLPHSNPKKIKQKPQPNTNSNYETTIQTTNVTQTGNVWGVCSFFFGDITTHCTHTSFDTKPLIRLHNQIQPLTQHKYTNGSFFSSFSWFFSRSYPRGSKQSNTNAKKHKGC